MVGYDDDNNALTLGDDDSLSVGDYELEYNSTDDQWQARYGRPIGGEEGFHGEILGPQYSPDSIVGEHSLEFKSNSDRYVNIPNPSFFNGSNISISVWAKVEVVNDGYVFYAINGLNGNKPIGLFYDKANENWATFINFEDGSSTQIDNIGSVHPTNVWSLVTMTYDGANMRLYLDDAEVSSTAATGTPQTPTDMFFGNGVDSGSLTRGFGGKIGDIALYNKALTATEVSDRFNGTTTTDSLVARYTFEYPETPDVALDSTGEAFPKNSVPRSTSDSLVPQGLAESVSAGEVLADDGNTYTSVQTAVDNATGWVFVGPGTFNESVTISTAGLTLEGSGFDTHINAIGLANVAIDVEADNVTVKNLSISTDSSIARNGYHCVTDGSVATTGVTLENVTVRESNQTGFRFGASIDTTITSCDLSLTDGAGIRIGQRSIVSNCTASNTNKFVVVQGDDSIVSSNVAESMSDDGIQVTNNDAIIIGNRIIGATAVGIEIFGTDTIVANNRVSDSGTADIDDNGTGTVLDGNLTGASN